MPRPYSYCLFGLRIRSEIELPELAPSPIEEPADIEVCLGQLPGKSELRHGYLIGDSGAGFIEEGVGGYWITGGKRILVEPDPRAPMRNVRLYVLGSAMGVALHQRGLLPLHANCIEIEDRAFLFMGRSGAGKSTLAAAFYDRGFRVIADDVCVIDFDGEGRASVMPGVPRLRLWEEALHASGRNPADYRRSFVGDEEFRKYDVPIDRMGARLPVGAIYRLSEGADRRFERLGGAAAAEAVFANTYRGSYLQATGKHSSHWSASIKLLSHVPIFDFSRVRDLQLLDGDVESIILQIRDRVNER